MEIGTLMKANDIDFEKAGIQMFLHQNCTLEELQGFKTYIICKRKRANENKNRKYDH